MNPDHEVRRKAGCDVNNGGCHADATCTVDAGQLLACTSKPRYAGDGHTCTVIPTPEGSVFFTTPTMRGDAPGSVQKYPGETAVAPASDPTGLAVDAAGNIYFGEVTSAPVRVSLKKRSPDGDVADLGVVVDTAAGIASATWTFDVARDHDDVENDPSTGQRQKAGCGGDRRRRRRPRRSCRRCRREPVFRLDDGWPGARDVDEAWGRRQRLESRYGRRYLGEV